MRLQCIDVIDRFLEPALAVIRALKRGLEVALCCIPCDHLSLRSWPLFKARDLMRGVIESLKAESLH